MPQIKVLNNLLLAINYSRIFVGCFIFALIHELLNKSINLSKVFSLSLRYSIYKVQTVRFSLSCELLYVITSCRICQALFTSFFKFFCEVCRAPGRNPSSHNQIILPQAIRFVKHFFSIFRIAFDDIQSPAGDLHILALPSHFVKHFFTKSYNKCRVF